MKKILLPFFSALLFLASCKKEIQTANKPNKQLYPLAYGNKWAYVDSFFDDNESYYGKDTFFLKASKTITFNNLVYTPIRDQYDEAIFTIRSDDKIVFMLEPPGESLMFSLPLDERQSFITNSYYGDSLNSIIYTQQNTSTNYPSYKILITQDDGQWYDYRQQEIYFTSGIGIIKGRDTRKNSNGDFNYSDSYNLISYSFN